MSFPNALYVQWTKPVSPAFSWAFGEDAGKSYYHFWETISIVYF